MHWSLGGVISADLLSLCGRCRNRPFDYAYSFQLLVCFAAERYKTSPSALSLEQLDAPLVLAFLEFIETMRGNAATTRNARLAAIKAFAHFVEYRVPSAIEQVRRILAIPLKKTDEPLVDYLNREELQALLDSPDINTRSGIRDRAMLHVCFAAGLRVSELVGLRLDELQTHPQASIRVRGKGRRERVLPLWKETAKVLRNWLNVRMQAAVKSTEVYLRADPTEKLEAMNASIAPSIKRGHFKAPDRLLELLRKG